MLNSFAEEIADRYVLIIEKLAEMAGANLIVGDLIRNATRNCLVAMSAAGAESGEIRQYAGGLIGRHIGALQAHSGRTLAAWVHARNHMEFLLFIEEQDVLPQSAEVGAGAGVTVH
ncbi:hypothetical protein [Herbaspirillum sp. C9C3]|uniref:hypothetical protein n=1 Tax=Herbaspirillum sp. C9C3 TaxID=2735271 RepID=UPI0015856085|nr:hypothetical protein [Herbaspirillum sp. C9C3]NUT60562.1 hypothetical protein [Herbaspirillum sp. C9C3]